MLRRFVTLVTGVPRSGTSLMMQMLAAGGIPPFSDGLREPDPSNPNGYLELEAARAIQPGDEPRFLALAEGHALKLVHALLRRVPAPHDCRVIWMRRELDAVLRSQRAMREQRADRTAADREDDDERLRAALRSELAALEAWLAQHVPGRWLRVDYEALCTQPEPIVAAVDRLLGGGLDRAAMLRAIDPALRRSG